jgi:hypothetical protein
VVGEKSIKKKGKVISDCCHYDAAIDSMLMESVEEAAAHLTVVSGEKRE